MPLHQPVDRVRVRQLLHPPAQLPPRLADAGDGLLDYVGVMNQGKLVEEGTPEEIYSNPVHPYTKALLSAIPVPDPGYERARACGN